MVFVGEGDKLGLGDPDIVGVVDSPLVGETVFEGDELAVLVAQGEGLIVCVAEGEELAVCVTEGEELTDAETHVQIKVCSSQT